MVWLGLRNELWGILICFVIGMLWVYHPLQNKRNPRPDLRYIEPPPHPTPLLSLSSDVASDSTEIEF